MAAPKKTIKRKSSLKRIDKGQLHVHASFNNTIITITDMQGNVISWSSAGKLGYRGAKKNTEFAAQTIAEDAGKKAKEMGVNSVEVYVKGAGKGRESAIRAMGNLDIAVTMIKDVSPIAHNGCRPPKRRRI